MPDLNRPPSAGASARWFALALLAFAAAALIVPALQRGRDTAWLFVLIPLRLLVSLGVIYGPALIVLVQRPAPSREVQLATLAGVVFTFAGGFWLSGDYALIALVPFPGDLPWMALALATMLARAAAVAKRTRPLQAAALVCAALASGLLLRDPPASEFAWSWPISPARPLLAAYDAAAPWAWVVPLALAALFFAIDRQERARAERPA